MMNFSFYLYLLDQSSTNFPQSFSIALKLGYLFCFSVSPLFCSYFIFLIWSCFNTTNVSWASILYQILCEVRCSKLEFHLTHFESFKNKILRSFKKDTESEVSTQGFWFKWSGAWPRHQVFYISPIYFTFHPRLRPCASRGISDEKDTWLQGA